MTEKINMKKGKKNNVPKINTLRSFNANSFNTCTSNTLSPNISSI